MRNRAKCKLCGDILESYHRTDYVSCSCGEITIDGGSDYMKCSARDWKNFLRVDDLGNVIIPKIIENPENENKEKFEKDDKPITKEERIAMLDAMVKNLENLPNSVMSSPVSHYDLYSFLLVISEILKNK